MDFRATLNKLQQINEGQKWDDLDKIVTQYAKPGMSLDDLAAMEKAAIAAEPADSKEDDNIFSKGFNFLKQAASTEDFRKKYVLAHAAEKLNLPGLYDSAGKGLNYLDDEGEATSVGGANKEEAKKIHDVGLLPKNIQEKFGFAKREVPVDDESSLSAGNPRNKEGSATTQAAIDNKNKNQFKPIDTSSPDEIVLSDGTRYSKRNSEEVRQAYLKAKELMDKADALSKKAGMEESLYRNAASILGEKAVRIVEEVSSADRVTLKQYIDDLKKIASASFTVQSMKDTINDRIKKYEAALGSEDNMDDAANTGLDSNNKKDKEIDFGSEDNMDDAANTGLDKGSEENMDDEANTGIPATKSEKFKSGPSSDLADFAKSGKKGLANESGEEVVVKDLQTTLNSLGFDAGTVDGKYGRKTKNAVEDFQDLVGITVDGDAGPATIEQILKVKAIKYNGKGFAELRKDLERAETLIKKASSSVEESNDFRKMLKILEGRLFESLSDAEADELAKLLKGFEAIKGSDLPAKTSERLTTINADANKVLKGHVSELELDQESDIQDLETMPEKEKTDDGVPGKEKSDEPSDAEVEVDFEKQFGSDEEIKKFPLPKSSFDPSSIKSAEPDDKDKDNEQNWDSTQKIVNDVKDAILGAGTDEEGLYAAIAKIKDKDQWNDMKALYPDLEKDLLGDMQGFEEAKLRKLLKDKGIRLASFSQILTGRNEKSTSEVPLSIAIAKSLADELEDAMSGLGTDEEGVFKAIEKVNNQEEWNAIKKIYPDVDKDLDREFSAFEKQELLDKLEAKGITIDPNSKDVSDTTSEFETVDDAMDAIDAIMKKYAVQESVNLSTLNDVDAMKLFSSIVNEKWNPFKSSKPKQSNLPLKGGKLKLVSSFGAGAVKLALGFREYRRTITWLLIGGYVASVFGRSYSRLDTVEKQAAEISKLRYDWDKLPAAEREQLKQTFEILERTAKESLWDFAGSIAADDISMLLDAVGGLLNAVEDALSDFLHGAVTAETKSDAAEAAKEFIEKIKKQSGSESTDTTPATDSYMDVIKSGIGDDPDIYNSLSDEEKALYNRLKGQ